MIGNSIGAVKKLFRSNGLLWGAWLIAGLALRKLQGSILASVLNAPGINFGPGCHVSGVRCIRFGRDVRARSNLSLEAVTEYAGESFTPRILIGDRVRFSDSVFITAIDSIEIGDDVLFGSGVFVSDHNHGAYSGGVQSAPNQTPVDRPLRPGGPVVIERSVWLGDKVNIVGPARIGEGAVIAAHAVVRGDVPAGTIVAGAPARVIRRFDAASGRWLAATA